MARRMRRLRPRRASRPRRKTSMTRWFVGAGLVALAAWKFKWIKEKFQGMVKKPTA